MSSEFLTPQPIEICRDRFQERPALRFEASPDLQSVVMTVDVFGSHTTLHIETQDVDRLHRFLDTLAAWRSQETPNSIRVLGDNRPDPEDTHAFAMFTAGWREALGAVSEQRTWLARLVNRLPDKVPSPGIFNFYRALPKAAERHCPPPPPKEGS